MRLKNTGFEQSMGFFVGKLIVGGLEVRLLKIQPVVVMGFLSLERKFISFS